MSGKKDRRLSRKDAQREARAALSTIRDLLRHAVSRFNAAGLVFGHGSADAWDEAVYLVLHRLHLPLDRLDPFLDARVTESERNAVLAVIDERVERRVPAAYLTGEAWLGPFRFVVDPRVIVPRSLIAELLLERLSPWIADPDAIVSVLDLCTGSGCLAIVAAEMFPAARIEAVDLSRDALAVARINVDAYCLGERVRLVESDLFAAMPAGRHDLIVCNPPYVNDASMAALPAEYRHEPRMALAGGADGMDFVRRILAGAVDRLADDGLLVLEIGHERAHVEAAFPDLDCTWLSTSAGDDAVFAVDGAAVRRSFAPQRKPRPRSSR